LPRLNRGAIKYQVMIKDYSDICTRLIRRRVCSTITGTFNVPDSDLNIDYSIDHESGDNWTLLAGFNWDFNRRISWAFEYNGFIGSREAIISSFNVWFWPGGTAVKPVHGPVS